MKLQVIGIIGPAKSGKDLVADWLVDHRGFVKVAYADLIKRFLRAVFMFPNVTLWGSSEMRNMELPIPKGFWEASVTRLLDGLKILAPAITRDEDKAGALTSIMTWFTGVRRRFEPTGIINARIPLQMCGTEWGRAVDPLIWCNYVHNEIIPKIRIGMSYDPTKGIVKEFKGNAEGVVIPDHRFLNEVKTTQEKGGRVIRLRRKSVEQDTVGIKGHASEVEQQGIPDSQLNHVFEVPEGVENVYKELEKLFKDT